MIVVGVAQEKGRVPRTIRKRYSHGTIPWIDDSTAMVNFYYFYCLARDFGPFFLKFCCRRDFETNNYGQRFPTVATPTGEVIMAPTILGEFEFLSVDRGTPRTDRSWVPSVTEFNGLPRRAIVRLHGNMATGGTLVLEPSGLNGPLAGWLFGEPGREHRLESSPDLRTWTPGPALVPDARGEAVFSLGAGEAGFFRARRVAE